MTDNGDSLGDRQKGYEMAEAGRRAMPLVPLLARLDGKGFSGFTRGLERPFDARLTTLMVETTWFLVEETVADVGYTQSDEITLAWRNGDWRSQIWFDGRLQKMCSVLAALASVKFNRRFPETIPEKAGLLPVFDCRVWSVPNEEEAANAILWREQDAAKNSVQMAAREHFSHRQLLGKTGPEMQEMLFGKGINWNDYPASFKRGTYVRRRTVKRKLTAEDLEALPPLHHARQKPDLEFERTVVLPETLPRLTTIRNRAGVLLRGEDPVPAGEV